MNITQQIYGTMPDGQKAQLYTIDNGTMSFSVTDYGCIITSILVPDSNGKRGEVTLGLSSLEDYITKNTGYFGAVIGRFANRIGGASFTLDGRTYRLDKRDGENCLHGGFNGYDKMLWHSRILKDERGTGVLFTRTSSGGEQGFPGTLKLEVLYMLDDANNILMEYTAHTDQKTPISLTNHTYFNLAGAGSVFEHQLKLNSSSYLEVNEKLIPTGKFIQCEGTPFDFQTSKTIGQDIGKTLAGYDHCFIMPDFNVKGVPCGGEAELCAQVYEPHSGRKMSVYTNQPGVQFYSANFLEGKDGRGGIKYKKHEAFCLETQQFPDAPNHAEFPSCILEPGKTYKAVTVYGFSQ